MGTRALHRMSYDVRWQKQINAECGMRNAEIEVAEFLLDPHSTFRLPNSRTPRHATRTPQLVSRNPLISPQFHINQAELGGIAYQFDGAVKIQLVHDVSAVIFNGFRTDEKFFGNFF